ncbi:MAG TPA: SagB family peptide dehydrogenase [Methylovirgula sp.]|nr:SagB family peptide dehydrogenase [Methylovirgula sp.]
MDLAHGLPLASFAGRKTIDKEIDLLVRRLASQGFVEYCLGRAGEAEIVIEPQVPDYWPAIPQLRETDTLVLSRFAYLRRRGDELVLESPRAGALFRICDPNIAASLALLSSPRQIKNLRRQENFPGPALFALLLDCRILLKIRAGENGLRPQEGDANLVLWDFHDLLFHARSTAGRHANPLGGTYPHSGTIPPLPALRPGWPGKKIDLGHLPLLPLAKLLRTRHSTRSFDERRPITLAELSQFLHATARVLSTVIDGEGGHAPRPYASAGAAYELELYLSVNACEGLARGFYHYDANGHALVPIDVPAQSVEAQLIGAQFAMGAPTAPQILVTIAARFGRVAWKYSSVAYALILKDAGVLMQTFYLVATEMRLGGCAVGITDIELFAKMTGIEFHVEGPVGQFALGRPSA